MSHPVALTLVAVMAAAGCSRTTLDAPCPDRFGKHAQPSCSPATADPPTNLLLGATALAVLSAQCDVVAVVMAGPDPPELRVSLDGGTSFGPPRPLPTDALLPNLSRPRFEPIAMAEDGALYVLAQSAHALRLYRSDDFGESFSEPVEVPGSDAPWGASLVVRGQEVTAYWLRRPQPVASVESWLARSRDAGRSFDPPVRIAASRAAGRAFPSLCLAGEHGAIGSWLDCTETDCSGDDRDGIALGMIAVSTGSDFGNNVLFTRDNGVRPPIAGCFADGRALVAWAVASYVGNEQEIAVVSVLPCGGTIETARFAGGNNSLFAPWSPTVTLGPNGALLHWVSEFASASGIAVLDTAGALLSAAWNPDLDEDGAYDLPISACPLPGGGYALLSAGADSLNEPVAAVAAIIADDGAPRSVRLLGHFGEAARGWVSCDGRDRAHFLWQGPDGASYTDIVAAP